MTVEFPAPPSKGRIYRTTAVARMGDVDVNERLRFDAAARLLQDLASDDSADAQLPNPNSWVVKWVVIDLAATCGFGQVLHLSTWASGVGARWAERRSSMTIDDGASVAEAVALWVRVDVETGRPERLDDEFHAIYGEAAGGRKPPTKLGQSATVPAEALTRPWHPRVTDMDLLGHVNNAAYFHIIEQLIADRPAVPRRVALEYRTPIATLDPVTIHTTASTQADGIELWVTSGETVHLTGQILDGIEMPPAQAAGR